LRDREKDTKKKGGLRAKGGPQLADGLAKEQELREKFDEVRILLEDGEIELEKLKRKKSRESNVGVVCNDEKKYSVLPLRKRCTSNGEPSGGGGDRGVRQLKIWRYVAMTTPS